MTAAVHLGLSRRGSGWNANPLVHDEKIHQNRKAPDSAGLAPSLPKPQRTHTAAQSPRAKVTGTSQGGVQGSQTEQPKAAAHSRLSWPKGWENIQDTHSVTAATVARAILHLRQCHCLRALDQVTSTAPT